MIVEVDRKGTWQEVVDGARFTANMKPLGHEPSEKWKEKIVRAEHSPIRLIEYDITIKGIPYYVAMHLRTHMRASIEVALISTSRPDRTHSGLSNDEIPRSTPVNAKFRINIQGLISISRQRLCKKASKETTDVWERVLEAVRRYDPIVTKYCAPNCIYRGFCPEFESCGFANTAKFREQREKYINLEP